jgi:predicted glycogen debranching enzyme
MIALPGLTLRTGRFEDAERILRSYAPFVRYGLLPNSFPDAEREEPWYHTVDAALWYVHAVRAYRDATGDEALVDDLLPTLRQVVDRYHDGTRFGIGVDPADGLVRAGVPGVQLTWMDARADDWVVTPRMGKPIEIAGLWVHACRTLAGFCAARGQQALADRYAAWAEAAASSFRARYFRRDLGWCADVLDGPDGDELHLRPNQLLALAVEPDLFAPDEARAVVDACARELLVAGALRSLAPSDPAYLGAYRGDRITRDAAYHQGTAWTWLIGPFVDAARATGWSADELRMVLDPVRDHLRDAGLGTISECLEGEPPHRPVACHAQAWSVAEALRALRSLDRD